ncbi:hypothetical protein ACH4FX_20955 [Streptomyces sp. NPDC018019]|uniref:hypothetical protein n=1 Tax=Streptomyces sp. NPDC018019 TaxID=3365030 RepID=UPI00379DE020
MKFARRIITTGVAVAVCAAAVVASTAFFHADKSGVSATVVDARPGYAVEGFGYPGSDKIKEETGIVLKRGDGHIMLADCSSDAGLMQVKPRKGKPVCFRITGPSGYLTLEFPSVHTIKGSADHSADVTLTAPKAKPQQIEVPKGEWTPVGESVDPDSQYTLVEIRTSK